MKPALFVALLAGLLPPGGLSLMPSAVAQQRVDVELVLAADGSGSIDDDELAFQRRGYAEAITSPDVLNVIRGGREGAIAISYVEWGGPLSQHTIVDWTLVHDETSARAFADALVAAPRAAYGYNSISGAIDYAAAKIETNGYFGLYKVIDVSGDGPNIGGRPVTAARDDAVAKDIKINALVILRPGGLAGSTRGLSLQEHYEQDVIGGFGSFVMTVETRDGFADAVRRKMVLEIAQGPAEGNLLAGR